MTTDIETRLKLLEDRAEIAQLRAAYCHVLDHRDWDALVQMFTEDGEFNGLAHARGRAEIHQFFAGFVDGMAEGFWHFCTNPTIAIDKDTATGRISMQYLSVKKGVSYVSAGHYDDRLERVDGVWKFRERKISFYYHAPLSEGFVGKPTYIHIDGTPRVPQPA
ncbi:nuclear transport factor 2 family protein [Rhodovulum sulfidophilum]|uniref:Nuclear transport factor 2 family protein n=1 Tax=Rhodovulum sulfidophilum TaxID=35806 RepID=A0ABS1RV33_RHOSU|nr:nuclear transport factor 2 family protein [Rhodovulum sulfidophilum]MBL3560601.1 nuclear transport factor 2 family protein [Rhodovulum sulfidophilum]MBL3609367.1 nuclear transport factor 2 family protein [Rhodovulum sulfidophilum]MCE8418461.1 nuclear transport factor 2 family protein [Rhodovulum sulfidophilum]MCE8441780.1 nuclear transport factor 2 family protein [Rhodovulum sulfidophilum]MCE8456362.1 nuclear transport factor 2 family protein [Rhodovulum sulfidophilum]